MPLGGTLQSTIDVEWLIADRAISDLEKDNGASWQAHSSTPALLVDLATPPWEIERSRKVIKHTASEETSWAKREPFARRSVEENTARASSSPFVQNTLLARLFRSTPYQAVNGKPLTIVDEELAVRRALTGLLSIRTMQFAGDARILFINQRVEAPKDVLSRIGTELPRDPYSGKHMRLIQAHPRSNHYIRFGVSTPAPNLGGWSLQSYGPNGEDNLGEFDDMLFLASPLFPLGKEKKTPSPEAEQEKPNVGKTKILEYEVD